MLFQLRSGQTPWKDLGKELRVEMRDLGIEVVGDKEQQDLVGESDETDRQAELREATRLLQLRVDYYQFPGETDRL